MGENANCRICRKKLDIINPVPYLKCSECGYLICDDCVSDCKSTNTPNGEQWKCLLCHRKKSNANQLGAGSDMHRVPSMRRMAGRPHPHTSEEQEKIMRGEDVTNSQQPQMSQIPQIYDMNSAHGQRRVSDSMAPTKKQLPSIKQPLETRDIRDAPGMRKLPPDDDRKMVNHHALPRYAEHRDRGPSSRNFPKNKQDAAECWPEMDIPVHGRRHVQGMDARSSYGNKNHAGMRSLSSASESSLDDQYHYREYREDSDGWKRRRSRVRRRSKIQRQKNYDEDPDSDPTNNATNFAYQSRNSSSRDSWDSLDAVEYERDHGPYSVDRVIANSAQRHLLDVPNHRDPSSSSPNKYSSGSCSDVSDLSADFSSVSSVPVSPHQHARTRRLPRPVSPRPTDLSDNMDNQYYEGHIFDSSPSSDPYSEERQVGYSLFKRFECYACDFQHTSLFQYTLILGMDNEESEFQKMFIVQEYISERLNKEFVYRSKKGAPIHNVIKELREYSQSSMTKSSSVEDTTFGEGLYAPASHTPRRSIPNLDDEQMKDMSNQLCTRSRSYNFDVEKDGKGDIQPDGSYGRSLPAITIDGKRKNSRDKGHYGGIQQNGRGNRRATSPNATSRSLNLLNEEKSKRASARRQTLPECENIKIIVHDCDTGVSNRAICHICDKKDMKLVPI
ncbi:hypothetical protein GQR58_010694 [Nymphon striatum]|nr:hypothetical protein GQR58_010694 [Nymphon striatum]